MYWLRSLLEEVAPVVVFFVLNNYYNFTIAMLGMVFLTIVILVINVYLKSPVPKFAVVSTMAVAGFAFFSIILDDSEIFKVSDTILDGGFALVLFGSLFSKKTILEYFFAQTFAITTEAWRILTIRWAMFFTLIATLNEYIRVTQTDDVWVSFKLLSTLALVVFGCYQFTLSSKMRIHNESNWLGLRISKPDTNHSHSGQ